MKIHVLAFAWLGGINAATIDAQSGDTKVQCFTYLSTYLAPIRSPIQPSVATFREDARRAFFTSTIHPDELGDLSTSSGQIGLWVASGTYGPFYTNTPTVPTSSEANKPNLGNKKDSEVASVTHGVSLIGTSNAGGTSSTSDSYDEPDVASGTYGPFYTDTPALPTLAVTNTNGFTSTSQWRPDVASGTYSPFYRDTPTLQRTRTSGDGALSILTLAETRSLAAMDASFTLSTSSSSSQ